MIRLFVGFDFPPLINSQLELMSCGLKGARWITPDNLHLTVRFIGDVNGGICRQLAEALHDVRFKPFAIELKGLNYFRQGRQINNLWAGVKESEQLNAFKSTIDSCLAEFDIGMDRRRFVPHVTLARVHKAHPSKVEEFIGHRLPFSLPPFELHRFHLFSSSRSEKGANYEIEQSYPLATTERERLIKQMEIEQEKVSF